MAYSIEHTVNEGLYAAKRGGRYFGGQFARIGLRVMTAVGATMAGVSGSAGALYLTGLMGIGTGVGLQAYLNHKDFEHSKDALASMYKNEISSYLGRDIKSITVQHLEQFAETNPSMHEHIERERNKRNVNTGVWVAAGALGFMASAAVIATGSVAILAGVAGLATILAVRPLIQIAGDNMYQLNEPTTVDMIKSLELNLTRARSVSQAQVMEVYISASPAMSKQVEQQYGAKFSQLDLTSQQHIINQHGDNVMLDEVTQAINENRMNARELTFRVHGKVSGAYPDPSYKEQWNAGVSQAKERAQAIQQNVTQKGQQAFSTVKNLVSRGASKELVEPEQPLTKFQDAELARRASPAAAQQRGS